MIIFIGLRVKKKYLCDNVKFSIKVIYYFICTRNQVGNNAAYQVNKLMDHLNVCLLSLQKEKKTFNLIRKIKRKTGFVEIFQFFKLINKLFYKTCSL